jgi:hypothetical protein
MLKLFRGVVRFFAECYVALASPLTSRADRSEIQAGYCRYRTPTYTRSRHTIAFTIWCRTVTLLTLPLPP